MEKAFCYFRYFDGGKYNDIGFGRLDEPFSALAMQNFSIWGNNATEMLQMLQGRLSLGKAVTVSTPSHNPPAGTPSYIVPRHAYSVDYVNAQSGYIVLRNPWGKDFYDGVPTDTKPSDGYIVLTAGQFYGYFNGARWSDV
jgi:hypothetical protein